MRLRIRRFAPGVRSAEALSDVELEDAAARRVANHPTG